MDKLLAMALAAGTGYMKFQAFNTGMQYAPVLLGGVAKKLDASGDSAYVGVVKDLQGLGLAEAATDYLYAKTGIVAQAVPAAAPVTS